MRTSIKAMALGLLMATGSTNGIQAATTADFPTIINYDRYNDGNPEVPGRLFTPSQAVANPTQKYPLVIFLHGAGEVGTNNTNQINGNINNLLIGGQNNGFYIYAPQSTGVDWDSLSRLNDVILAAGKIVRDYNVDPNKIYITGLSAGGGGSWLLISSFTNMFAAAVPICGDDNVIAANLVNKPIWAFHARDDGTVSVDTYTRANINAIRLADPTIGTSLTFPLVGSSYYSYYSSYTGTVPQSGASYYNLRNLIYSEYTSGGHGIWGYAYGEASLYTWLLAQTQSTGPTPITQLAAGEKLLFDFGSTAAGTVSGQIWNSPGNASSPPLPGVGPSDGTERTIAPAVVFAYANTGHRTPVILTVTKRFNSPTTNTNTSTVYPSSIGGEGWEQGNLTSNADSIANPGELQLSGLTPSALYNFKFYGSDNSQYNNCPTRYTLNNSVSADLTTLNNTANFATINNVAADSNGRIQIDVAPAPSSTFHALLSNICAFEVSPVTGNVSPAFTNNPAPVTAVVGTNYNNAPGGFTFTTTGSPTPGLTIAGMPAGMNFQDLGNGTATLSGAPNTAGNYSVTVTATNTYASANHTSTQSFQIAVSSGTSVATISGTAPNATVGVPYTFTYSVGGSPAPTLSLGSGNTLPTGLSISGSSITGIPTATVGTTYTGNVIATNGVGSPASVPYSITLNAATLPSGWAAQDVGTTGATGSSSYDSNTQIYTVNGAGSDIWNNTDAFQFLYQSQTLTGDGSIVAKLNDVQNNASWAKTGLMMRSDFTVGSTYAMVCDSPTNFGTASFMTRAPGESSIGTTQGSHPTPIWLKLTRQGNLFSSFYSSDGNSWTPLGSRTFAMPNSVYVGLVNCSNAQGTLGTAHFSNVTVSSALNLASIGNVATGTGTGSVTGSTYSVACANLSGNDDIWNSSDSFQYLYEAMPGDGSVIVHLNSMTNTSQYAKAGIMIRKDLTAGATHASMCFSPAPSGGTPSVNFLYRTAQGGSTLATGGNNYSGSVDLKLIRSGSSFTGWVSTNGGTSWTQLGSSVNISGMTGTLYVGLVECSHTTTTGTATFTNVVLP